MLELIIQGEESWNDELQEFVYTDDFVLQLEHSLVSLSKWEEIWEKPFLGPEQKTDEEAISYLKLMTLNEIVPPEIYQKLTNEHANLINKYLEAKMSATWFKELANKGRVKREVVTAEVIYYWMIKCGIPSEFKTWHLNRLFTLIKVFNEKDAPPKKVNTRDAAAERQRLNAERKARMRSKG